MIKKIKRQIVNNISEEKILEKVKDFNSTKLEA